MFVQVAVPGPFPQGLTYLSIQGCIVGQRVMVPLRQRKIVGIVTAVFSESLLDATKLKPVFEVFDEPPLFDEVLLDLMAFVRTYYHASAGDVFYTAMPSLLCKGKPLTQPARQSKKPPPQIDRSDSKTLILNGDQLKCVDDIALHLSVFSVHLLEGVTGSGKTEVYLELVQKALDQGRSVLVLVPEIGLTPQTLKRFQARFGPAVAAYHSGLTETAKRTVWRQTLWGEIKLVIGTRSAIFLPLQNLGLLVIDEEHDSSYKQNVGVTYSAKSIAIKRAMQQHCAIILGSATPSIEALYFAREGRYHYHQLNLRARGHVMPEIKLIDMRQQPKKSGLSRPLLDAMRQHLEQKKQVLIFLNRRGYAPIMLCHDCGARLNCPDCEMSYTLHQRPPMLICHHCSRMARVPKACAKCGHPELITVGQGTEQLEECLNAEFSQYAVVRLDQDAMRLKGSLEATLKQIHDGEAQIIIGTQMLAKGHDFAHITLVGIVDLDYGFFAPDFRGMERMGQLLIQVAGRAGRFLGSGEVLIQTHVPDHPLLRLLLKEGYRPFATELLEERKAAGWPPFQYMALFRAEHRDETKLMDFLNQIKTHLAEQGLRILGPVASTLRKKALYYRAQLLLESPKRAALHQGLSALEDYLASQRNLPRYTIDVDPLEV